VDSVAKATGTPATGGGNPPASEPQKDINGAGEDGKNDGCKDVDAATPQDVDVEVPVALSADRLKRIQNLFTEFDVDGLGNLPLSNFSAASLKVGPHESGILTKLKDMDYDTDGFITKDEWEKYFTAMAELSDEEFSVIIDDMSNAAGVACSVINCTRIAAEAEATTPPVEDLNELPPLSAERTAKIEALFAAWDVAGTGSIDRSKLKGSSGMVGPHKVHIFSQLDQMDINNDNLVEKDEMLLFFRAAAGLSDDEFDAITDDLMAVAQNESTIAMLTSMAVEYAGAPPSENVEDIPAMSETRLEQLKGLWGLLSSSTDTPISLEEMKKAERGSTIGPHSVSVLKEMYAMDANSDGKLQWSELLDYFTKAGSALNDDEFSLVVGDMTTQIQVQLLAQMVSE